MNVSTSYTYTGPRSSSYTFSVPSLTMSRIAVYKPPRSSPLAGPAISVNIDDEDQDDEDDDNTAAAAEIQRNEKGRISATHSRPSSPYPTPPRTPSPSSDYSTPDPQSSKAIPEIGTGSTEPSSETRSKSHAKKSRLSVPHGSVDASSQLLGVPQDESSTRRSSRAYVRTPFSAPPTMADIHPSYDTNAISVRAVRRPRTAPGSSSLSSSSSSPAERGTFSAPGIIKSTAGRKRHEVPNTQSNSDCNCKMSIPSSSSHHLLHSCPDTSSNPKLNWVTVSNGSPPPFSRTFLTHSVVMPVKATEAEVKRSSRRPKTMSNLQSSSISPLSGFQVQEVVSMSRPMPILKSLKEEERREQNYQSGPFVSPSHDEIVYDGQVSKEVGIRVKGEALLNLHDNEVEKAGPEEELVIEDRRAGGDGGRGKLKLLLKIFKKANL